MKKVFCIFLVILLVASLFVGCNKGDNKDGSDPSKPSNNQSQETTANIGGSEELNKPTEPVVTESQETKPARQTKEEQIAVEFLKALMVKDYKTAIEKMSCSLTEDSYVFEDDIQFAIPRSDYKELEYFDPNTAEYATRVEYGGTVYVTIKDASGESQEFKVYTEIARENPDGTPTVNGSGKFYYESYMFRTPGGAKVEIDSKEVPDSLITTKNAGKLSIYSDYTIPYIGTKDKSIRIYSDLYDTVQEVTPKSHNSTDNDETCRLQPEYRDETILVDFAELLNNIFEAVEAEDSKVSDLYPYFATDVDLNVVQTVFDNIKKEGEKDLHVNSVIFRPKNKSFWSTKDSIVLNFGYELQWTGWGTERMTRYSYIVLKQEEGTWKVYKVLDNELFTWFNEFTHDY